MLKNGDQVSHVEFKITGLERVHRRLVGTIMRYSQYREKKVQAVFEKKKEKEEARRREVNKHEEGIE